MHHNNTDILHLVVLVAVFACSARAIDIETILDVGASRFNVTAQYVSNITNASAAFAVDLEAISVSPCLIERPRVDACAAAEALYGGFIEVAPILCETNNISICRYAPNYAQPCTLITPATACTNVWCEQYVGVGPNPTECRNYPPSLPGYACGATSYCTPALACVDARADRCNTTLALAVPTPPAAGVYPVRTAPDPAGFVFAHVAVLATGRPALLRPLQHVSPGTIPDYAIGAPDPSLTLVVDDSEIRTPGPGTVSGDLVGLLFRYTLGSTVFAPIRLFPVIYVEIPVVFNLCPGTALAFVATDVLVSGSGFHNSSALVCFLANQTVPVRFIDATRVVCTITPTDAGAYVLAVSNDGVQNTSATVLVLGACDAIKPGSAVSVAGDSCECPAGTYDTGVYCQPCLDGSYQPAPDQGACIPCDAAEDTRGQIGATSSDQCVCRDGYNRLGTAACVICGTGLVCANGTLGVLPGYWRSRADSYDILACGVTIGGDRCTGGTAAGDALCGEGYEGPVCAVCAPGFGSLGESQCAACTGKGSDAMAVLTLFLLACFGIGVLVKLSTARREGSVGSVIKIFMNYVQIVYYIGTLAAHWSPATLTFFSIFLPMSISPSFISVRCVSELDFYARTTLVMFLPALAAAFLVAVMLLADLVLPRRWKQRNFVINLYTYLMVLLIVLYIIHPMIASATFSALNCTDVPGVGGGRYLSGDMSVDCTAGRYVRFRAGVCVFIALYVFGAPLYVMRRMNANYAQIQKVLLLDSDPHNDAAFRYVYAVRGYRADTFLWEGVVLFRKLAIVGVAALVGGGLQLVWCWAVLVCSMILTVQRRPFSTVLDNRIEIIAHAALIVSILLAFHSYFTPGSGAVVLAFLICVNGAAIAVMVFSFFARFRKNIHIWTEMLIRFVTLRKPESVVVMFTRGKPDVELQETGAGANAGSDRKTEDDWAHVPLY